MSWRKGQQEYIMEKRHPDGKLDLSDPQPPFLICTEQEVFDHFFRNNDVETATQEEVRAWYAAQGFSWRVKYW